MTKKVMILDDEPDTVELTKAILEINAFETFPFTKPKEALAALKNGLRPDLVICDVRMPEMSGPEFCEQVRSDENLRNIKIVYFTASSDADKNMLKEYGLLGFIFKPFDNDKLIEDIKCYINLN